MQWNHLEAISHLDSAIERSYDGYVLLFKHSTTCSISHMAKMRLESKWSDETNEIITPYYLDLKVHRDISNHISEKFSVHHESPQVLLIKDGECIYDASHMDISVEELKESVAYHA
jgi:bacillithiol system protein YtxJ